MKVNLGTIEVGLAARWGIALWNDPDATQPADDSLVGSYFDAHIRAAREEAESEALQEKKVTSRYD